jgi:hypothetical protein
MILMVGDEEPSLYCPMTLREQKLQRGFWPAQASRSRAPPPGEAGTWRARLNIEYAGATRRSRFEEIELENRLISWCRAWRGDTATLVPCNHDLTFGATR